MQCYGTWCPLFEIGRAHRVSGHYKRQKRSFHTILKHFKKKEFQNPSKFSCQNWFSKLTTWYLELDEILLNKILLWGMRFHLFWRRLCWDFDRPPKCQVSNFENRFWHEIFDGFWNSFFKSALELSGKTIYGVYNAQSWTGPDIYSFYCRNVVFWQVLTSVPVTLQLFGEQHNSSSASSTIALRRAAQ